jgi:asparagine synthase (glutamine-hydrolysing)
MSGIVGIFNKNGSAIERPVLERMLQTLAHRGPDASNLWQRGQIGFGHCMLWTTPESLNEVLPLHRCTADLVITADARIDNREELFTALTLNPLSNPGITDSELILAAYQKWGKDCPNHLLGDFVFAIWDIQNQTLFCARDHFGIKPFYYYSCDEYFIFASEIKALLSFPGLLRQLNEIRIADYFLEPMLEDKSTTIYKEIFRLPPAHWMHVVAHKVSHSQRYWALDSNKTVTLATDEDYALAFRDIFFEAVRCRLRSAFPVGSHLSGGLDSSTVTCVAHEILRPTSEKLHTFSNIFDRVVSCDEREYFNHVLEQGCYIPHFIPADQSGPLSDWQAFFQYFDEPFLGPSHFLVHGLNRATQAAGVRICLDGFDGDTVVSHGAYYFKELARQGDWKTFIAEAQAVSKHFDAAPGTLLLGYALPYLSELAQKGQWLTFAKRVNEIGANFTISRRRLWIQYGLKPIVPQWILRIFRRLRYGRQTLDQSNQILNPLFVERPNIREFCKSRKSTQTDPSSVREDQQRVLDSGTYSHVLELSDQCASAFSIEVRHPFMDKRLVEFCLALPPEQKLNSGWSRVVMRRAMAGILPEPIQWRGGKASMEENFEQGLLNTDRPIIENILFDSTHNTDINGFLNLKYLRQCFTGALSLSNSGERIDVTMVLWKAAVLSLWLKHQWLNSKGEGQPFVDES